MSNQGYTGHSHDNYDANGRLIGDYEPPDEIIPQTTEQIAIQHLGEWVDKCDNFLAWLDNPAAPQAMKLDALTDGMRSLRDEMLELYLAFGGVNEWEHTP